MRKNRASIKSRPLIQCRKPVVFVLLAIVCLLFVIANQSLASQPYRVAIRLSFSNQNWYPLSVADMKRAAVDSALAELSQGGNFIFLSEKKEAPQTKDRGLLTLDLSLIEPAEMVKLTLTLQVPEAATIVSSASGSLTGKNRKGIFQVFESVGRAAAKKLQGKLPTQPARKPKKAPVSWDTPVAKKYQRAQRLKSQYRFKEANKLFVALSKNKDKEAEYWAELARDELAYGLLMFEADHLALQISENITNREQATAFFARIEKNYRQVIQDNPGNLARTMEAQRKLDALKVTRYAVKRSMEAMMLSSVNMLRPYFANEYAETGEWPRKERVREMLEETGGRFEVKKYRVSEEGYMLILKDLKLEREVTVRGDMRRFEVK